MRVIEQIIYHLRSRGRLTDQEMAYLGKEGFCQYDGEPDDDSDWHYSTRWNYSHFHSDFEDRHDPEERAAQELLAGRRRVGSRRPKPALKAADLNDQIAAKRPEWAEIVEPLVVLAKRLDASVTQGTAPRLLQKSAPPALLPLLTELLRADSAWFSALWEALRFEEYRHWSQECGNAGNAYRSILMGRELNEIMKDAWILREAEVAWVYALVTAQRNVAAACRLLYDLDFPLLDTHLGRSYRSGAFLPYTLLYSARKYVMGELDSDLQLRNETTLPMALLPAADSPLWSLMMDMERQTILPYMLRANRIVASRNHKNEQDKTSSLICPQTWYKPY
jgi:hypothetical protein